MPLTVKSTVYLSLVQVTVTVFGILTAATSQKIASVSGRVQFFSSELLMDIGLVLLSLPLIWITLASTVRLSSHIPDDAKRSFFVSGLLLLGILVVLASYGVVRPWTMPMAPEPAEESANFVRCHELQLLPATIEHVHASARALV